MFHAVVVLREKKSILRICFAWKVFKRTASTSFYLFLSSVNYYRIYSVRLIKSRFVENVLFYPRDEVMDFPKM